MKSKYSILFDGKFTHIVCRPKTFREGDCVISVDGSSITRLDRSDSGALGERQGGMFFKMDFNSYPNRYVKIMHSNKESFQKFAPRMVLVEKTLPYCAKEFTIILGNPSLSV